LLLQDQEKAISALQQLEEKVKGSEEDAEKEDRAQVARNLENL
jgi:hypothetical protein